MRSSEALFNFKAELTLPRRKGRRRIRKKEEAEMEVVIPGSTMDFDFNSSRSSSPFLSTPSSPKRFGEHFLSAPTSPTRVSEFYRDFDEYLVMNDRYEREEREEKRPGTGTPKGRATREEDDFAFDVGEDQSQRVSLSAEELFDGGKIRPLTSPLLSPKAAASRAKKTILGALSPRRKKEEEKTEQQRGRERTPLHQPCHLQIQAAEPQGHSLLSGFPSLCGRKKKP
jgi:hypothetical protein